MLFLFLLAGVIVGSIVGNIIATYSDAKIFNESFTIGTQGMPAILDFNVIKLAFGLSLNVNSEPCSVFYLVSFCTIDIDMMKIILASASPRRKQLLEQMGLKFDVITSNTKEQMPYGLDTEEIPVELAYKRPWM